MTRAWRIDLARWGKDGSFSGTGARLTPGRWNSVGTALVYAASSLSLATLEKFVHIGPDGSKIKFVKFTIDIPDTVTIVRLDPASLPKDWLDVPPAIATQQIGDTWFKSKKSAVLAVPSTITPGEFNFLLNPEHPEFDEISIADGVPFGFDLRMWKTPP